MKKLKVNPNQLGLFDAMSHTLPVNQPKKIDMPAGTMSKIDLESYQQRTNEPIDRQLEEPVFLKTVYHQSESLEELGDYAIYKPQITVVGAKPHPSPLCESIAMASISLPKANYRPKLLRSTIEKGLLSNAQLEDIILAGNAHQHFLHQNYRQGFMVGSGTGFGKGNTIAGIIFDNYSQGRTKAVWISKNDKAHMDSAQYWQAVGGRKHQFIDHSRIKKNDVIRSCEGVLCTTYGLMKSGYQFCEDQQGAYILEGRLKQIIDWLGDDFEGVIVFDESHAMANAIDQKSDRGVKKGSMVAQVGLMLQKLLPKARIVYSSATGATEVSNLVYADRLGLYGPGTEFSDSHDFIKEINASGVAAMEFVAQDLKARGLYTARTLSYEGVSYDTVEHKISPIQHELYDQLAKSWQIVLENIHEAIEVNGTGKNARSAALSAFWGAHQRFFNLIILTIQMPTIIEDIKKHLESGDAIVIQLTNTNEAQTNRAIAEQKAASTKIDLASLDISPKSILIDCIKNSFPTIQFEEYIDIDGNTSSRPVTDSEGNYVENLESIQKRDDLITQIEQDLVIPQSPLDTFINTFGSDNVAEVTGRSMRLIKKIDDHTGEPMVVEERRSPAIVKKEIRQFKDDEKRILIFSAAGGTGSSYHADKNIKNQRRRVHYVFQPGWRADEAVQGFGRSHRSNQVCAPLFKLCTTNIEAQKRFMSSIAKRLQQLGALTKGQRTTGGQGILDEHYNLEGTYAVQALYAFYLDVYHHSNPISIKSLEQMMGLKLLTQVEGSLELNHKLMMDIKKFLNRILSLEIGVMNKVFSSFESKMFKLIEQAKAQDHFTTAVDKVEAQSTEIIESYPIYTHERTGAKATLTTLRLETIQDRTCWLEVLEMASGDQDFKGFYQQVSSKKVYAVFFSHFEFDENQNKQSVYKRVGVVGRSYMDSNDLILMDALVKEQANYLWNTEFNNTPETKIEFHSIIKGILLPIWKQIPGDDVRVKRYVDNQGNTHLGRFIPKMKLSGLRNTFNIANNYSIQEVITSLNQGFKIRLSNGMLMNKSSIQGIPSIKVTNVPQSNRLLASLQELGFFIRIENKLQDIKSADIPKNLIAERFPQLIKNLGVKIEGIY